MEEIGQKLLVGLKLHGFKILAIIFAAYLINRFLQVFIGKIFKKHLIEKIEIKEETRKRTETLIIALEGTSRFVVYLIAFLMILPEFGISVAPILASLGIAGLALGMAVKDIVSDFISVFFIILENQYQIGDKVTINGIEGVVKEITLRRTVILDENNTLHFIPNSLIKTVSKKL